MIDNVVSKLNKLRDFELTQVLGNYPKISGNQKALWHESRIDIQSNAYNLGVVWECSDPNVTEDELENAVFKICKNNRIFRSVLYESKDHVHMISLAASEVGVSRLNFKDDIEMTQFLSKEYQSPFLLTSEFPARFFICKSEMSLFLCGFFHHIVMDGVSITCIETVINKILKRDDALLSVDYFDYLFANDESPQILSERTGLWDDYYEHFKSAWFNYPSFGTLEIKGAKTLVRSLPEFKKVSEYSRKKQVQLFSVFHLALAKAISALTKETDFFIATTDQNRHSIETQNIIGYFARTIKLKTNINKLPTNEQLKLLDDSNVHAFSLPTIALSDLHHYSNNENVTQPYQVVLELQRMSEIQDKDPAITQSDLLDNAFSRDAKNDISLFVCCYEDSAQLNLEYDSNKVSRWFVEQLMNQFEIDLAKICGFDKHEVSLSILQGPEKVNANLFNKLYQLSSKQRVIPAFLNHEGVSYEALIEKIENWSQYITQTYAPKTTVAILAPREADTLVLLYAAWAAGYHAVLIPDDLPEKRGHFMCQEIGAQDILAVCSNPGAMRYGHSIRTMPSNVAKISLPIKVKEDFGYVIFSSGTTGTPKGVLIEQAAIENLASFLQDCYADITRIALNAEFTFDASYQQIVMPFFARSVYILTKEERLNIDTLVDALNKHNIEAMDCTPSQLAIFFESKLFDRIPSLRVMLVGGERISAPLLEQMKLFKRIKFFNVYGPCESAVDTVFMRIEDNTKLDQTGYPICNTKVAICNEKYEVCRVGQVGELVIMGASLGAGYVSAVDLERKKFRKILTPDGITQAYITGDYGYVDSDGCICVLGRKDNQIKVNGARIELDEIASLAKQVTEILDAHAILSSDSQQIFLYCTLVNTKAVVSISALNQVLKDHLPTYMLPSEIHFIDAFPLNKSGKLDASALLKMLNRDESHVSVGMSSEYKELAQRICAATGINITDINLSLFSAGINSLMIFKIIRDIRSYYDVKLTIGDVITHPSLKQLLERIRFFGTNKVSKDKELVTLKKGEFQGPLLILLPPVGGRLDCYHTLINALPDDVTVMGIEADIGTLSTQVESFEQLCERYLSHIKAVSKNQPVTLVGWSYGGVLAFEIARRLLNSQIEVKGVTLIDAVYSGLFGDEDTAIVTAFNSTLLGLIGKIGVLKGKIPQFDNSYEHATIWLNQEYGISISNGMLEEMVKNVFWHRRLLREHYFERNSKVNLNLEVIWARQSHVVLSEHQIDWRKLTSQDSDTFVLDGDHYSIIHTPQISELIINSLNHKEVVV
ncbi:putative bacitracin synthetase 1; BacA [Moritella sp. PE36]|uniref:AMP-binding protein n=1 Tax=Moritella sp. PE36 TaxID=58051 RepID=UPI0001569897|nr:AMP-binding protein [Moritella sp. PE36]EDM66668.1 putative bacitracin synthetase 1; BacA [Moritella sp. PE36]